MYGVGPAFGFGRDVVAEGFLDFLNFPGGEYVL